MRLIESVTELVAGDRASGGRRAQAADFYFDGNFPGEPVVPAVILVEMVAQLGGLAAAAPAAGTSGEARRLRIAAIGPFKFPGAATAGAWLEARVRVVGRLGAMYKIEGSVTADGALVATGSVTLADAGGRGGQTRVRPGSDEGQTPSLTADGEASPHP